LVAKYILEAILIDERFVLYRPSLQAASALYIGRSMQGREDWVSVAFVIFRFYGSCDVSRSRGGC
jgi:hypothetical protein